MGIIKTNNVTLHRIKLTKSVILLLSVVVILVVAALIIFPRHKKTVTTIPSTKPSTTTARQGSDKQTASVSPSSSTSTRASDKSTTPSSSTNSTLAEPFGTFVSNHKPNLDGSPAPSQEQSVCNTTPRATCYIQFSKDGMIKKLEAQVTDPNGAVYWTWDVKQSGFTQGSWQITAIASLDGQTKTVNDVLLLEVQP